MVSLAVLLYFVHTRTPTELIAFYGVYIAMWCQSTAVFVPHSDYPNHSFNVVVIAVVVIIAFIDTFCCWINASMEMFNADAIGHGILFTGSEDATAKVHRTECTTRPCEACTDIHLLRGQSEIVALWQRRWFCVLPCNMPGLGHGEWKSCVYMRRTPWCNIMHEGEDEQLECTCGANTCISPFFHQWL